MRNTKMLFLCMTFVFLVMFPMVMFAQVDLTETYTSSDGTFSISYPAGYTVNDAREGLVGIRGAAGLFQINFYDNNGSGYAPVTAREFLEVGIGEDEFMRSSFEYSEPEEVIIAGFSALQSSSSMMNELHVVIDFGDGVLAKAIGFATNLGSSEPVFMAMLNSIRYGDGPQPIVEESLDNAEATGSANTSQIAQLMTLGDANVSVESVAFNWDNRLLAIGTADGEVQIWDAAIGETRNTFRGFTGGATSVAFGAGANFLAIGTGSGYVELWDVQRGEPSGLLQGKHDTAVTSIAFQIDGSLVVSGAADGSVKVWDIARGSELPALAESDQTAIGSLAFSPDGTLLAIGSGSSIRVWNTASRTFQAELETEISDISSVSFRPDGTAVVYGGADPAVWVWDLADSNQVLLEGHVGTVAALALSLDGDLIASADDESVRLWDAATGTNLAVLASPSDQGVNSVAFKPDGTLLASGGPLGGVMLWDMTGGGATQDANTSETSTTTTTEETTTAAVSCTFSVPGAANLRSGPGTTFVRAGALSAGQTVEVDGQTQGTDGMTWYRLATGEWVRSDVVGSPAACENVPAVSG